MAANYITWALLWWRPSESNRECLPRGCRIYSPEQRTPVAARPPIRVKDGGGYQSRTGLAGFAIRCMAALLIHHEFWSRRQASNLRHAAYDAAALPTELRRHLDMAPQAGIEPATSGLTVRRNYRCATGEWNLEPETGIEPATSALQGRRSAI